MVQFGAMEESAAPAQSANADKATNRKTQSLSGLFCALEYTGEVLCRPVV